MTRKKAKPISRNRASRDGHEFHEAWAARKALQLLFPPDDLVGIGVEGLAPEDEKTAAAASIGNARRIVLERIEMCFIMRRVYFSSAPGVNSEERNFRFLGPVIGCRG